MESYVDGDIRQQPKPTEIPLGYDIEQPTQHQQLILPKITNPNSPKFPPLQTHPKLLQLQKPPTHHLHHHANLHKTPSILPAQPRTIQTIKLLNSNHHMPRPMPMLAKTAKKQHLSHVLPRLYQHLGQMGEKTWENQMVRVRMMGMLPQLESAKVLDDYRVISHVGKGCFSVVSSAVDLHTNKKVAIKTYTKIDKMDDIRLKNIQSEVQNLFTLHHTNIISLKHAVKDGKKIQLIMQNGGQQSLSGLLRKTTTFPQQTARKYFKQIAQALAYCHSQNVCHRDIKLENILVDDFDRVKLIDFGFSIKCDDKVRLTSFCGTPPYMSPELAARLPYSAHSSDVWALGITLYLMITGKFPFKASNQKQLYRLIQQGKYKTDNFSPEIKQLLDSMLKVDQKARITSKQIIESNWLNPVNPVNPVNIGNENLEVQVLG